MVDKGDMATESKQSVAKVKPSTNQDGFSKGKIDSSVKNKKIESSRKQPIDSKNKSVIIVTKTEVPPSQSL